MPRPLVAVALVATAVVAACGAAPDAFDLAVGDCIATPDPPSVTDVERLPCDEPHGAEVYAVLAVADDEFPGADEIVTRAQRGCTASFEGYVGEPYAASALSASSLTPTVDSWGQGDRKVVCYLYAEDGELTGSRRSGGGQDAGSEGAAGADDGRPTDDG